MAIATGILGAAAVSAAPRRHGSIEGLLGLFRTSLGIVVLGKGQDEQAQKIRFESMKRMNS